MLVATAAATGTCTTTNTAAEQQLLQLCMCCCLPGAAWCMRCCSQLSLMPATVLRPCCVHHAPCVLPRLQQMAALATAIPLLLQQLLPRGPKDPGAGLGSSRYGQGSLAFWQCADIMAMPGMLNFTCVHGQHSCCMPAGYNVPVHTSSGWCDHALHGLSFVAPTAITIAITAVAAAFVHLWC